MTLKKAEETCRAREKAKMGAKLFNEKGDVEVEELSRRFNKSKPFNNNKFRSGPSAGSRGGKAPFGTKTKVDLPCKFCVRVHKWGRANCPA